MDKGSSGVSSDSGFIAAAHNCRGVQDEESQSQLEINDSEADGDGNQVYFKSPIITVVWLCRTIQRKEANQCSGDAASVIAKNAKIT